MKTPAMSLIALFFIFATAILMAGDSVRPGLEGLDDQYFIRNAYEQRLVSALKDPFIQGLDIQKPLQKWFDGRLLDTQGRHKEAVAAWKEGISLFKDLKPLPDAEWGSIPEATLHTEMEVSLQEFSRLRLQVVQWSVGGLKQYGVVYIPSFATAEHPLPVILYAHGAAFGLSTGFIPWLATLANRGYVIAAPAMRGEPLFYNHIPINGKDLVCEGEIENLDGEVDDCLSLLNAVWKQPYARKNGFAMVGHSFGAGVGLLAAARAGALCKAVVSYDAWLVCPQRYYWDRMNRGANNWLSWADYCNHPVDEQLNGLMKRSIVHNAAKLKAQLLFFIGGAYKGSVFHQSHDDLFQRLKKLDKPYSYNVMEGGGHNFVLYTESAPAQEALKIQTAFLDKHYPPAPAATGK